MNVRILDPSGAATEGSCAGPAWSGVCPMAGAGEIVACAGRNVIVTLSDGREMTFAVDAQATSCPLAALGGSYRGTGRLGAPPR